MNSQGWDGERTWMDGKQDTEVTDYHWHRCRLPTLMVLGGR